jgi:hypothetical protein
VPARNDTSVSSVFAHAYWERRFVVARRILPLAAVPAAAILLPADDARRPRMQEPRVIGAHRRMTTPPAYSVARDASVIRGYVKKYTYTEAHTDNVMRAWSRKVGPLWGVSSRQIRRQPRHGTTHRSSSARPSVTPRERDTYTYTYTKARAHANTTSHKHVPCRTDESARGVARTETPEDNDFPHQSRAFDPTVLPPLAHFTHVITYTTVSYSTPRAIFLALSLPFPLCRDLVLFRICYRRIYHKKIDNRRMRERLISRSRSRVKVYIFVCYSPNQTRILMFLSFSLR